MDCKNENKMNSIEVYAWSNKLLDQKSREFRLKNN